MTREEAIEICKNVKNVYLSNYGTSDKTAEAMIVAIEALKQPEQKKGKWLNDKGLYRCSLCNELWTHWWAVVMQPERMYKEMKYCPNCGAEMEEEV